MFLEGRDHGKHLGHRMRPNHISLFLSTFFLLFLMLIWNLKLAKLRLLKIKYI